MDKVFYSWNDFEEDIVKILEMIKIKKWDIKAIVAIPKGGLPLGVKLANTLQVPLFTDTSVCCIDFSKTLLLDDISDSGATFMDIHNIYKYKTLSLVRRKTSQFIPNIVIRECEIKEWISFPWESKENKMIRDRDIKEDINVEQK